MARKSSRIHRVAPRRLTTWLQFQPIAITLATNATATLAFTLNAAALALRPFTVVRTHFQFMLGSDQAANIEQQSVGVGMAIVSDQASAIGITAVPTPIIDMASPLFFAHTLIFADESSVTDRTRPATFQKLDSKAMRKVEVGEDLVIMVEGGGIDSGMVIRMAGRILIKNN